MVGPAGMHVFAVRGLPVWVGCERRRLHHYVNEDSLAVVVYFRYFPYPLLSDYL
jgi:hypothetical protein